MKLIAMEVAGFRSFRKSQRYDFSQQAGLVLVKGENLDEPALGANGAGKSTFWDIVCWVLFGKTARGFGASHVESWGKRIKTRVMLEFELDGQAFVIERTRSPIMLLLNGETVTQEVVDDALAMDYEKFMQVCLMAQFGELFADMKPTARLNLISQVLDLDLWTRAAKQASEAVKQLERSYAQEEKVLHGLTERETVLRESHDRLIESFDSWVAVSVESTKRHKQHLIDSQEAQEVARKKVRKNSETERALLADHEELERELGPVELECRELTTVVALLKSDVARAKTDYKSAVIRHTDIEEAGIGTCDACEQEVSGAHFHKTLENAAQVVRIALKDKEAAEKLLLSGNRNLTKLQSKREELAQEELQIRRQLDEVLRDSVRLNQKMRELVHDVKRLKEASICVENEENPFAQELRNVESSIDAVDKDVSASEIRLFDILTQLDLSEDWPKLFKEMRLWLVDEALDELSIYVNSSLVELGLHGWEIEFIVERETKSGTTSRGFEILVYSGKSPDGVLWESWSGGETQRLRIACAAGMSMLMRSRMPSQPVFEVWDEPTRGLGTEGVKDLISYFSSRADTRQVWVVDHHSIDSGMFDSTVTITKNADGSKW